ncbi:Cof-type HAD-IIB family hydrolase [Lactobacillus sp. PV034]|uniref:Cof-type HAD-IIB family hydrolase n=1 Tax=Lactobacillus sp. PV034 TaxID=2594495 RepID=UPI00223EBA69|nr:Cof-type HAD-IIB family hydrolase [Lactobacillus sp. PV034]QNQ80196.1 HAD family hydrolase [Lactobacillus sp. PV034]
MTLPFKAVAVDMDGTFLNEKRDFDHQEFAKILDIFEKEHIQFIVASGRPYARLKQDFVDFRDRMDFVTVNGARLVAEGKQIGITPIKRDLVLDTIKYGESTYHGVTTLVFGPGKAFVLKNAPEEEKRFLAYFAGEVAELDNWLDLPDEPLVQVTFNCGGKYAPDIEKAINDKYGKVISAYGSADFAVDVDAYGVSKAEGLKELLAKFNLTGDDLIAFGDGGNDLQMLKLAKYSYAMENGIDEAKSVARYIAPKNSENGVFRVLEDYIHKYLD